MEKNSKKYRIKWITGKLRLHRSKPALVSVAVLLLMLAIGVFSPFLANDKPLYFFYKGQHLFPAFTLKHQYRIEAEGGFKTIQPDIADWKRMEADVAVWAPVAYSPGRTDKKNNYFNADYKSPFDAQFFMDPEGSTVEMPLKFRHWLGTGKKGEDVLAGLLHGARHSLFTGIFAMLLASVLGIVMGGVAGYFGDTSVKVSKGKALALVPGFAAGFYYAFILRKFAIKDALADSVASFWLQIALSLVLFLAFVLLFLYAGKLLERIKWLKRQIAVPVDGLVLRAIEILNAVPWLVLVVTVAAVLAKPSHINLVMIIGLTYWTSIARFVRAEFLRVKAENFMEAGRALGFSDYRLIVKHALPNAIAPAIIDISFGVAAAVLIESGLSFIGIGVPADITTWGIMLSEAKDNFDAWWLMVFPGLAIFVTVICCNTIGEELRKYLNPNTKATSLFSKSG